MTINPKFGLPVIYQFSPEFLALFSRSSTSDFIRSNDNRILVNVVKILFFCDA